MINLLAYSGGADSGATARWLMDNDISFTPVFCDTGWEHPVTLAHVQDFNETVFGGRLVTIRSEKFSGMTELVQVKKRVPSAKARFCTEHLKIDPMKAYIATLDDHVTIWQGIRRDESEARKTAKRREWSDVYDAWVERPIVEWNKAKVFAYLKETNTPINPLYMLGASRVGCFPCVLVNQGELRRLTETLPEVWDRIAELERYAKGASFFPPNYIPKRFHSGLAIRKKDGALVSFPTADDVKQYVLKTEQSKLDYTPSHCMSVYNLCE